jgi:hypothetical protein
MRYFRFSHVPEDAGDESVLIANDRTPWWCYCGQQNDHDDSHCVWCKGEQGDWICDCGRKNRKRDEECSDCGTPKPEP